VSNYNPYAPPGHDDDAGRPPASGAGSWDGTSLVVPQRFEFPAVCLKCASSEVHRRRTQKFAFTPVWARLLVVVCWPGALLAMLLTTKRATLEIPLCEGCHARWRQARTWSALLGAVVLIMLLSVSFLGGTSGSEAGLLGVVVAMVVLIVASALAARKLIRPRMLQAKKVDDARVTLVGVHPRAGERVARAT
jgi:hypothetical protein